MFSVLKRIEDFQDSLYQKGSIETSSDFANKHRYYFQEEIYLFSHKIYRNARI